MTSKKVRKKIAIQYEARAKDALWTSLVFFVLVLLIQFTFPHFIPAAMNSGPLGLVNTVSVIAFTFGLILLGIGAREVIEMNKIKNKER